MHGKIIVHKPILQVLGTNCIAGVDNISRYRLLLSDGKNIISTAMLATQINGYADENKLTNNTIIRVENYAVVPQPQVKKVIVILDLTVLRPGDEVGTVIGEPKPLTNELQNRTAFATETPVASNSSAYGSSSNMNAMMQSYTYGSRNRKTFPISNLKPHQTKWVIKARVTSKSTIRTWSNTNGQGNFFNMDLKDESGVIRASAFNEVVDKFYNMIQVDKVYFISKCAIKVANKQFTEITHDCEVIFTDDTVVVGCLDSGAVVNTNRPRIDNLDTKIFTNHGPYAKEIVEISGEIDAGTTRLMHIMARVILPTTYGGKNEKVMFMVTAHNFDVIKFMNILETFIRESDTTLTDLIKISEIAKNSLGTTIRNWHSAIGWIICQR